MSPARRLAIFFSEDIIDIETWKVKQMGQVARGLVYTRPELCAFIQSDDVHGDRFTITVAHKLTEPLLIYEAVIIDEDTLPQLKCRFESPV